MFDRLIVHRFDVKAAARVAFALSLSVWGIAFVGLIALYLLGLVSGGLGGVEGFIASLGFTDFRLSILPFLGVFIVFACIASAAAGLIAALLAHLYNTLYPIVGGIELGAEIGITAPPPETIRPPPPPVRPQLPRPPQRSQEVPTRPFPAPEPSGAPEHEARPPGD